MGNLITVKGVTKSFGKKDATVHALNGVDMAVEDGEMVAITGKSGSGKSTLLNILGGLILMDSGKYIFDGKPVDFARQKYLLQFRRMYVGFVVQYFALIDDINVYENIALPLRYHGISSREIRKKVNAMLEQFEIEDKAKAYPNELSGGQQQRVSIARAMIKEPKMLLADEPTGALDEKTEDSVLAVFKMLHKRGKTILIVTHDAKVARMCDRSLFIRDGVIEQNSVAI